MSAMQEPLEVFATAAPEREPGVEINFDWGASSDAEKFLDVIHKDNSVSVTVHPGLSRDQVGLAAAELGAHGPQVINAWEARTGYRA